MYRAVSRSSPIKLRFVGLFFCLFAAVNVNAMDDIEQARNLLKKMSTANREMDYRGIFTYEHAGILKSIRITHVVRNGLEHEQLLYLNGPKRELVRAGVSPRCRSFGEEFLKGVPMPSEYSSHLETHYELFLKGEDRVAGRAVRVIHVVPRDGMRYGFILSVDRDTGLLLQSLLIGSNRRVMERFQYVDIDYQVDDAEVAAVVGHVSDHTDSEQESLEQGALGDDCNPESGQSVAWHANWLPPGFELVNASTGSGGETAMVYSDGLSFVSVFVDPDGERSFPAIQAQRGATVAQMARVTHNGKDFLICVVGEVPPVTAERIANFIAPKQIVPR